MTAIAGFTNGKTVVVGWDSFSGAGNSKHIRKDMKGFVVGPYVVGYTWSYRAGQILEHHVAWPLVGSGDLRKMLITKLVPKIRDAFKKHGMMKTDMGVESGGEFLVGVRGRLFTICSDFQVCEKICGYDAVGCGEDLCRTQPHRSHKFFRKIESQNRL